MTTYKGLGRACVFPLVFLLTARRTCGIILLPDHLDVVAVCGACSFFQEAKPEIMNQLTVDAKTCEEELEKLKVRSARLPKQQACVLTRQGRDTEHQRVPGEEGARVRGQHQGAFADE